MKIFYSAIKKIKTATAAGWSGICLLFDLRDYHVYCGLIMIGYGLHMLHPAAAWAIPGLMLFWLGVKK